MTKLVKRLYKSDTEKMIAGVCGGIAEYYRVDVALVRIIYVLLTLFTAIILGIVAYVIMIFIIPARPAQPLDKVILPDRIN